MYTLLVKAMGVSEDYLSEFLEVLIDRVKPPSLIKVVYEDSLVDQFGEHYTSNMSRMEIRKFNASIRGVLDMIDVWVSKPRVKHLGIWREGDSLDNVLGE